MEESVAKELQSLSPQFSGWDDVMRRYDTQLYRSDHEDIPDEHVRTVQEVHNILETILRVCTKSGHLRDTWDFPAKLDLLLYGQETDVQSRKMGVTFTLGIYHREIFLRSQLHCPLYIRNMGDEFWSCFVELRSLGNFQFVENAVPSSQEARKIMKGFKNVKSNIFQIIRNYIVLEAYEGRSDDLGSLEIKWPLTAPWAEIIGNAAKAFGYFYRISYMLYRVDYERNR
jgi:hypothetical protein